MSDDSNKDMAKYITAVVQKNLEGFQAEHLSDEQMKQLNPLIKNGVYTALHSLFKENRTTIDDQFVELNTASIPTDTDDPTLTENYTELFNDNPIH